MMRVQEINRKSMVRCAMCEKLAVMRQGASPYCPEHLPARVIREHCDYGAVQLTLF